MTFEPQSTVLNFCFLDLAALSILHQTLRLDSITAREKKTGMVLLRRWARKLAELGCPPSHRDREELYRQALAAMCPLRQHPLKLVAPIEHLAERLSATGIPRQSAASPVTVAGHAPVVGQPHES